MDSKYLKLTLSVVLFGGSVMGRYVPCELKPDPSLKPDSSVDVEFVILITSYNNEKWVDENLRSACFQKSSNPYEVICINDKSSDKTGEIMDKFVTENGLESFVTVIHNEERVGGMANIYNAVHDMIEDKKVVVSLDGDDMLVHDSVLLVLEQYYKDKDVWMTYGSTMEIPAFTLSGANEKIEDWYFTEERIREHHHATQHLRTWRAKLFNKIPREDFLYEGEFMWVSWDQAFMIPMLEMCAPKKLGDKNHSCYVPEIVYYYRKDNPLNDFRIKSKEQEKVFKFVREKAPYAPLDSLD